MDHKHVVTFHNQGGHRLVGILHEPPHAGRRNIAVILLSPGVKSRVAPHRLYNKIADRLVKLGLWVFRFDFEGLGDADGSVGEAMLVELYRSIQLGRYVQDTLCSMNWLQRHYGIEQFVVGGLCGGAITGVLAAANRQDVVGIVSIGLPVMLDGSSADKLAHMTSGQLTSLRQRYLQKVLNPRAWLRVLTLKTDYRLLFRSVSSALDRRRSAGALPRVGAPSGADSGSNGNPHFPGALERTLANGCPILLMFSESDRLYWEFREKFADSHGELLRKHAELINIRVLKEANHVLTFAEWQLDMMDQMTEWLDQRGLGALDQANPKWSAPTVGNATTTVEAATSV